MDISKMHKGSTVKIKDEWYTVADNLTGYFLMIRGRGSNPANSASETLKVSKTTGKVVEILGEDQDKFKVGDEVVAQRGIKGKIIDVLNNTMVLEHFDEKGFSTRFVVLKTDGMEIATPMDKHNNLTLRDPAGMSR